MQNSVRLQTRGKYPLPKVVVTKTPHLDSYLRTELSSATKSDDKELAKIQTFMLDALAPLTSILEADSEKASYDEVIDATKAAVALIGNANAKISHLRRQKVISQVNKALMPIVDDDSNFQDSAPALFGTEFAKKSKDLVDQVKAMRVPLTSRREQKPFFRGGPPVRRGDTARGMGGAEVPNCTQEGFETGSSSTGRSSNQDLPADQPRSETSPREMLTCKITCGESPNRKSCKNSNSCIGDITTSRKLLASRTAASLSEQLEVVNKGSLGPRNSTGVLHRVCGGAIPEQTAKPTSVPIGPNPTNFNRARGASAERGNCGNTEPQGGVYSVLFLVPKKDGGQRPVINLKALNQFVQAHHFKMEGIHSLKEVLKPGEVDLKDAFFIIPIHVASRKYLRFTFQGKVYEFNCLPFGLSLAPWVFTKTLKPVIALLWELGVRLIAYINDILILAESREELERHVLALIYLLECMGYIINSKKSITNPAQTLEFLGLIVDTLSMELRLPLDKLKKIRAESRKLAREQTIYLCPFLSAPSGKDECNNSCHSSSSSVLQTPTDESHTGIAGGLTILRDTCHPFPRGERGTDVVGQPHVEMEWEITSKDGDRHSDRFRCIPYGMGCNQFSTKDWRPLVSRGKQNAYQLPGAACSYPRSQDICEEPHSNISFITHRQYNSCSIYKQYGGNSLSRAGSSGSEPLDVVPGEEHTHHHPVSPWCSQYHSRCGVSENSGSVRLEIESERILEDRSPLWSIEVDLFASTLTAQCPVYFSWRPDPYATATDAFLQDWSQGISFSNPAWGLIGCVLSQAQARNARLVLLAPVWKSQPWYPVLMGMLVDYPRLLPRDSQVMINPDPSILTPQLVVWRISGIDTEAISFRRKLWNSCSTPGEQRLTSLTTHSLGNGIAGVISKVLIPFQDL